LTPGGIGIDLTQAKPLPENAGFSFEGTKKYGAFDIPGALARLWLKSPNPNGRPNSDVLRPWANGQDLAGRPSDTWIIDFGTEITEAEAALYELPFAHIVEQVRSVRKDVKWWLHERPRPLLRKAISGLARYIATPRVAKHRFFVWLPVAVLPDSRLYAICRDNEFTFGVLSSRLHEVWALANASRHGDGDEGGRPTYNARDCFETFPFPAGLTPRDTALLPLQGEGGDGDGGKLAVAEVTHPHPNPPLEGDGTKRAIASAAQRLNELRENWLNPAEWTERIPEIVPGYPDRIVAKPGNEADLKKRTMTALYNARPLWLNNAHQALDAAVAIAYGWPDYAPAMPDAEILKRLLTLNLARKAAEEA
jgi:hypothetical protein